ncbi:MULTISPECIES: hypothetical protein [unclassified Bradyrhizobium]|uniref:hypothetical protein n=1 Tax=unclassified Bradyrhizobium TaxID=2631580 RepID=UPI002915FFE3|nr:MULTISPECIES: hypothetical protein [unclassified Bradyrhizobium]
MQASACAAILGACSLSPAVEQNSLDYTGTIEQVANKSLVTNILRARDGAPLYFPDLSLIHGAISASVSASSTLPWKGPSTGSTGIGPLSAGSTPGFDVAPGNTKQFYLGLMNPISDLMFRNFVASAQGYGSFEEVFHMLVSGIEVGQPGSSPRLVAWYDEHGGAEYLAIANRWLWGGKPPIIMKTKGETAKPFGPPIPLDAKAIVEASSAGLDVVDAGEGRMQFMKGGGGSEPIVCFWDGEVYTPVAIVSNSVGKGPAGGISFIRSIPGCPGRANGTRYALHLRSTRQVFTYLGSIVDNPQFLRPGNGPGGGCPRLPISLSSTPTDDVRFSVAYRNSAYYVSGFGHKIICGNAEVLDRTLPVLAILSILLNINRDANEIPSTKTVQAAGG